MVWALEIKFVAHTTRCKHPFGKPDRLSPHLEELLYTESHWFLKLLKNALGLFMAFKRVESRWTLEQDSGLSPVREEQGNV